MLNQLINILRYPQLLKPRYKFKSINQINQKQLNGIKYVIFDKDDTLTLYKDSQIHQSIINKLKQFQNNYKCIIVSNSTDINTPNTLQDIVILKTKMKKPHNFSEILNHFAKTQSTQIHLNQFVMIGDRLLTDIYMANQAKISSIYVQPLQQSTIAKHGLFVYLFRRLERNYLKKYF